jgi:NAD(P)-dependent dehydrogenase (short-subunit alcohol dehydrogenase family)
MACICLDAHAHVNCSLGLSPLIQSSQWTERSVAGARLLRERGTLNGLALDGACTHEDWRIRLESQASKGHRFYDGKDSFGVPAQTHVRVDLDQQLLSVDYRVGDRFRVGMDGLRRTQHRQLMSVPGGPSGYAEHWSTDALALRLGYEWRAHGLWAVNASWALRARSALVLLQANRDDAILVPHRQKVAHVAVRWDAWEGPGWGIMKAQQYGRIIFTTSSSGLFGNFGQSNYGAAKMALVGLMQTLSLEGEKANIRVNCLAPTAATQMTEGILTAEVLAQFQPERVSPGLVMLSSEQAPTRAILCAGAGTFASANVTLTEGLYVGARDDAADVLAQHFDQVTDRHGEVVPAYGMLQSQRELTNATQQGQ